ncbi:hypothetical protein O1611_g4684 [Lasiodiplodia mahajangana]|uniref:Uncharacterized protein n=1 Tax=Lasiodiplodia mahajangana TaxID=1108764 RepID=A0ACC2JNE2_9PEZI|nr:hypothetical protein O1611_g4684 [Lasiodiplodia mahajangana]
MGESSSAASNPPARVANVVDLNNLMIEVNFELFYFIVKDGRQNRGRRVASDFDYHEFRSQLFHSLDIPITHPLYPERDSGIINITDESSAIIALTQVQGSSSIRLLERGGRPLLRLHSDPGTVRKTPPSSNNAVRTPLPPRTRRSTDRQASRRSRGRDLSFSPEDMDEVEEEGVVGEISEESDGESDGESEDENYGVVNYNNSSMELGAPWDAFDPQAYAIYKTLAQVDAEINSFILADDAGLGKTGMSVITVTIIAMLHRTMREVQREWGRRGTGTRRHLSESDSSQDACPTQRNDRVQCPCVSGSLSRRLVTRLADLPTVVIAPPSSIPVWVAEADKFTGPTPNSPGYSMAIHVAHSSFEHHVIYLAPENGRYVMANVFVDHEGQIRRRHVDLQRSIGLSDNIILVSSNGTSQFIQRFGGTVRHDTKDYKFLPGIMIFDEFHRYRGTRRKQTKPFKMLQHFSKDNPDGRPVLAIGVSGSAKTNCAHWRPFIKHAFDMAQYASRVNRDNFNIAGLARVEDMDRFERAWAYLAVHLVDPTLQGAEITQRDRYSEDITQFLRRFIPLMMIARSRGGGIFGSGNTDSSGYDRSTKLPYARWTYACSICKAHLGSEVLASPRTPNCSTKMGRTQTGRQAHQRRGGGTQIGTDFRSAKIDYRSLTGVSDSVEGFYIPRRSPAYIRRNDSVF